jgi:hypothetical protein
MEWIMNKLEDELEAVKFTIGELKKKKENVEDKELSEQIQKEIDYFEDYRLELLDKMDILS